MQFVLFIAGTLLELVIILYLPETAQPRTRGIDKLRESESLLGEGEGRGRRWVWLNPFKSLAMFRSPCLLAVVSQVVMRFCETGER